MLRLQWKLEFMDVNCPLGLNSFQKAVVDAFKDWEASADCTNEKTVILRGFTWSNGELRITALDDSGFKVLGFGLDLVSPDLESLLAKIRAQMDERVLEYCQQLAASVGRSIEVRILEERGK